MNDRSPIRIMLAASLLVLVAGCTGGLEFPEISLPDVSLPDVTLPDLPDVTLPDLPDVTLPGTGESEGTAPSPTEPAATGPPVTDVPGSAPAATQPPGSEPSTSDAPVTAAPATPGTTDAIGTAPRATGAPDTTGRGDTLAAATTTTPSPGTSAVPPEEEGSPLAWLLVAIAVVIGLLAMLFVRQRSAGLRQWQARATDAYLEGRWIADRVPPAESELTAVSERAEGLAAVLHELELSAPTADARQTVRDVGTALVEMGRPDRDAGSVRSDLLAALDRLGGHIPPRQ